MNVYEGRPEDFECRKEKEQKVYEILDSLGIRYQRVDHEPVATIEACREVDEALGIEICKNLFLCNRQKTGLKYVRICSCVTGRKQNTICL